eukprot:Hpha_TRINITY_DN11939_c0_g1::TRINITY_DN11939_c0_g1_i1::g.20854::m.20854
MAFHCPEVQTLQETLIRNGASVEKPLGGGIGKDGDCLLVVGMQQDAVWGERSVPDPDGVGAVICRILTSLESRRENRWVVCAVKDYFPAEHCAFGDRGTRYRERDFAVAGTQGCRMHWRVRQALSVMRARTARRVVIGFKNYHEQIFSPSAFPYTQELTDDLAERGCRRDRDFTRHSSKLFVYSGAVAARCSAHGLPRRSDPVDVDAPPDVMALEPQGIGRRAPQLSDALRQALGNKQVRRLFICGVPFDEDVLDTALSAAVNRTGTGANQVAGNVYIILDATRPREGAVVQDTADTKGDPDALRKPRTPSGEELVWLLNKYGVRLCNFEHIITPLTRTQTTRLDRGALMFAPVGATFLQLFAPQLLYPGGGEGGQGQQQDAMPIPVIQKDDDDDSPQGSPARVETGVAAVDDDDEPDTPHASPGSPVNLDTAELALGRSKMADETEQLLKQVAPFEHHIIRNDRSESTMLDLAPRHRLGYHFTKWLGRSEDSKEEFRPGCPVLKLRTKFPASLASLNLIIDPTKMGLQSWFGTELFQLRSEEAVVCSASYGFATQCGAMLHIHRVLAKLVNVRTLSFYTSRIDVPLKSLADPNSHHPADLVREADLTVRSLRAAGKDPLKTHGLPTPQGSKGSEEASTLSSPRDDAMYEAEWWATRQRQMADEWQNELFLAAEAGRWIKERRRRLLDEGERRDFDDACEFSISELATLGVSFARANIMTSGRSAGDSNQIAYRGAAASNVLIVQACGPDFAHPRAGAYELGRHFEINDEGREGKWLDYGQERLHFRALNTWQCVCRAFQSERCYEISLVPLCADSRSLSGTPAKARAKISEIYVKALLRVLEDSWGFINVYFFVPDPGQRKLVHTWIEEGTFSPCCNVVLHDRDPKFLAWELSQRGMDVGLLCPADPAAVLLGAVGGNWEKQSVSSYGIAEDLAHTSTMLLSHVGIRNDGIATDKVIFHSADTPVWVLLANPSERVGVHWHRPGGQAMSTHGDRTDGGGESKGEEGVVLAAPERKEKQASRFAPVSPARVSDHTRSDESGPQTLSRPTSGGGASGAGSSAVNLKRGGTKGRGKMFTQQRPGSGDTNPRPGSAEQQQRPSSAGVAGAQPSSEGTLPRPNSASQRPGSAGRPPTGKSVPSQKESSQGP